MVMSKAIGGGQERRHIEEDFWRQRIAKEDHDAVRSMGKAIKLGIISELPCIKKHENIGDRGFQRIYNKDPTFHNIDLSKENSGLARNFFGVGTVHITPNEKIVKKGLTKAFSQYQLTPYGLYPNEKVAYEDILQNAIQNNNSKSSILINQMNSPGKTSKKCYNNSLEKQSYMASSIDLTQPIYERTKITNHHFSMKSFPRKISAIEPPENEKNRFSIIADAQVFDSAQPLQIMKNLNKNHEIWKSKRWDEYLEKKDLKKLKNKMNSKVGSIISQEIKTKNLIRDIQYQNKLQFLKERRASRSQNKMLHSGYLAHGYKLSPRMESEMLQNDPKFKMKMNTSRKYAAPEFDTNAELLESARLLGLGNKIDKGRNKGTKRSQSQLAESGKHIITSEFSRRYQIIYRS